MSLNISLNEKMSTIYDHLKDVVEKGFEIMKEKNAIIPEIQTLETLLQSIERFPNIEPISNRSYKWKAVEAIIFTENQEIMPEVFYCEQTKDLIYFNGYYYLFYGDKVYMSTSGFNFGKDISNLCVSHHCAQKFMHTDNVLAITRDSLSLNSNKVNSILISYEENRLYMNYIIKHKLCEFIKEFDSNIIRLLKYTVDGEEYLIIATINSLFVVMINELFEYVQLENAGGYPLEDFQTIEFPIDEGIINIFIIKDSLFVITELSSYVYELWISKDSDLMITRKKRWCFIETPEWLYIDYLNDILYGFTADSIMKGTDKDTEDLQNIKHNLFINNLDQELTQIDLLYDVFEYKNYIVFISTDFLYITQSIRLAVDNKFILNGVRLDFPPALGALSKIFNANNILYLQGIGGQIYGLELPDMLGNPTLASRASYIANGMTGIVSKGAIGKDIEGITWKYRGSLPEGYTYKYAEANHLGLILAKNEIEASYQLYSIYDNGEPIMKLTDSIPELIIDEKFPSKSFFVSDGHMFYIFAYYKELERAIIYYSGGDYKIWIPYEVTTKNEMLNVFKNMNQIYASEEYGFLIDSPNISENCRFAVIGPNLECLDYPYLVLSMIQPIDEVVCSGYEDGYFFIVYQNVIGMVFQLCWDINITGQFTCRIINKNLTKIGSFTNNNTIFLDGFFGVNEPSEEELEFCTIAYSPYLEYSVDINMKKTYINRVKSAGIQLNRLSNSLLMLIEDPLSNKSILISYDGKRWNTYSPFDIGLPVTKNTNSIDFQHSKSKNVVFIDNFCYSNGFNRDTYQKYFTYITVFDLSKNNGQFHYHFEFSPRFVFFTIEFRDDSEANLIGGYISKEPITNYNLQSAMFEGYVNNDGNFKMKFITENTQNDLTGKDLVLMIQSQTDISREYQITLYAFA